MGYEQNYKVRSGTPEELHEMFCDDVHLKIGKAHSKRKSRLRKLERSRDIVMDNNGQKRKKTCRFRYCHTLLYQELIERKPEKMLVY